MRIVAYAMSYWSTQEEFDQRYEGLFGLKQWYSNVQKYLKPIHCFICCGTFSPPEHSRFGQLVTVVNAGAEPEGGYDVLYKNYSLCTFMAAFYHALNGRDWDLLCVLDTDTLIGAVDFDSVLREFMQRPEIHLSQRWYDFPGGSFQAWKREGANRYVNYRQRSNFVDDRNSKPITQEQECGNIFAGKWWNPWPDIKTMRQDHGENADSEKMNEEAMTWPMVRKPHPAIIERYLSEQTVKAKPVI